MKRLLGFSADIFGGHAVALLLWGLLMAVALAFLVTPYPWVSLAIPLVLAGIYLVARVPEAAYYAIVFLIPYGAYRKIQGASMVINIPWLIALALVVALFLGDFSRKELILRLRSRLGAPFLVFFAISALSTLLSPFPRTSAKELLMLLVAALFVSLGFLFIDSRGLHLTMPAVLITSITLGSCASVAAYLFHIPFFRIGVEGVGRATGFATDPNNMSLMILYALPLVVFHLLRSPSVPLRFVMFAVLMVNMAAITFTFSRGGFLVMFFCLLLLAFEHRSLVRPRLVAFPLLALCAAIAVAMFVIPPEYWSRQKTLLRGGKADTALSRRASYLSVAWDTFRNNPWLGTGPRTYTYAYAASPYARQFATEESQNFYEVQYMRRAHNTYLEVVVGTGLPGLLAFLAILGFGFSNFTRAARRFDRRGEKHSAMLVRSYRAGYIVVAVYLLIYSDLYHKYFLLSLSLSHVAWLLSRKESPGGEDDPGRNPAAA